MGVFGFGGTRELYNQGLQEFSEALSSEPDISVGPRLRPAVPIPGNAQNPWLEWAGQDWKDSLGGQEKGGWGGVHTLLWPTGCQSGASKVVTLQTNNAGCAASKPLQSVQFLPKCPWLAGSVSGCLAGC